LIFDTKSIHLSSKTSTFAKSAQIFFIFFLLRCLLFPLWPLACLPYLRVCCISLEIQSLYKRARCRSQGLAWTNNQRNVCGQIGYIVFPFFSEKKKGNIEDTFTPSEMLSNWLHSYPIFFWKKVGNTEHTFTHIRANRNITVINEKGLSANKGSLGKWESLIIVLSYK
jgi:hypothetical protein